MITPFYQTVIAIGLVLLIYVFISEKLWRKENWFEDAQPKPTEWSYSLSEDGILRLYRGRYTVVELPDVREDTVEDLVEELIHSYTK